ncbi:hypothetical protein [Mesobacillus zeae]|uniref:hypothetical protein n=1 Tax=Mesobacillus zeae TaxID=1917180 RepID=UPI0015E7CC26|nr:hypothetical protein [Mesobacillus zeae]
MINFAVPFLFVLVKSPDVENKTSEAGLIPRQENKSDKQGNKIGILECKLEGKEKK